MRSEAQLGVGLLLGCAGGAIAADEGPAPRCRMPPKMIASDSLPEDHSSSGATRPAGTAIVEVTIEKDGTVRDATVIEPVDARLRAWAIERAKRLRFAPVRQPCKTRVTFESVIESTDDETRN